MPHRVYPLRVVFSTRDKIIELLSVEYPLSTRKIHAILKQKYATSVTYQAVHKLLNQLLGEGVVERKEKGWLLEERWIEEQLLFFKKVNLVYKKKKGVLGGTIKAFAFDVNGVLTPDMTHVEFAKQSVYYQEIKSIIASQTLGKISIKEAFKELARMVKGISLGEVLDYSKNFGLMPGVKEAIKKLKEHKVKVGLVTTGFRITMEYLDERLGDVFDFIISNELIFTDGKGKELTGEEVREAIKRKDEEELKKIKVKDINLVITKEERKTSLLRSYLKGEGLEFKEACCIGDSMGDADFIKVAGEEGGMGIAFNPNLSLLEYARFLKGEGKNVKIVESNDLRDMLVLFM